MKNLSERDRYEFDLRGYVVLKSALSLDTVQRVNAIIDDHHARQWPRKFSFLHLSPIFWDILSNSSAMTICRELLGDWFRLDHAFGIQDPPAYIPQAAADEGLHAGPFANQGTFRYGWFGNKPRCGLIVFVYYLEKVISGDGGLVLIPGSHKSNFEISGRKIFEEMLHSNLDSPLVDNPAMEPGDLLVFTEAVVHGSKRWAAKDRRRRNLQFGYSPGFQAAREHSQLLPYLGFARNELERNLLRPPYAIEKSEDDGLQYAPNLWRSPTIPSDQIS